MKIQSEKILIIVSSMSCPWRILPVKYLSLWSIKSVNCNRSTINTKYILSHSQTNTTKYVNYTSQPLVAESFTQISCSRQPQNIFWVSKMLYVTVCTLICSREFETNFTSCIVAWPENLGKTSPLQTAVAWLQNEYIDI